MNSEILHPIAALALWTMIMWVWLYVTRIPAMNAAKVDARNLVGSTGKSLDEILPPKVQWIAHNYNHLHEAPTVFYAVALLLAVAGAGDGTNATIAWIYVFLRVAHSIVQAVWNRVLIRFALFALSSIALFVLVVRAYLAVV